MNVLIFFPDLKNHIENTIENILKHLVLKLYHPVSDQMHGPLWDFSDRLSSAGIDNPLFHYFGYVQFNLEKWIMLKEPTRFNPLGFHHNYRFATRGISQAIDREFKHGNTKLVEWALKFLVKRDYSQRIRLMCCLPVDIFEPTLYHYFTKNMLGEACCRGHLDIVKLICSCGLRPSIEVLNKVCKGGIIKILEWIYVNCNMLPTIEGITDACRYGHIKVVIWGKKHDIIMKRVSFKMHPKMREWIKFNPLDK
ncbi:MAG: hypothetical protein JKX76_00730 [Colwellia sp.]|nr:hypothetical protein [Colwellia sp.]